jgi:TRAP-type mannitol/chloroaromatic compound transport system permease large subunit
MGEVFRAAMPYCYLQVGLMALVITFPQIVLWLPGFMSNS